MKKHIGTAAVLAAAVVGVIAGESHAEILEWNGTNGITTGWTGNWVNQTPGGTHTFPQAGDLAQMHVNITAITFINIDAYDAVGDLSAQPNNGIYRFRNTDSSSTRTFEFNNNGSESTITVSRSQNLSGIDGIIQFGTESNMHAMNISLANDLRINNDGSRLPNGQVSFGSKTTIVGGTLDERRTITIEALGTGGITNAVSGAATFIGDWVISGAKATLDMNADAFGDASNTVTLVNGGVLDIDGLGAFNWNRSLSGNGTVKAAGGLTASGGSFSPGASVGTLNITTPTLDLAGGAYNLELSGNGINDLLNVTGEVTLGGTLNITTLDSYIPTVGDSWIILSASEGVSGNFSNPLPVGYIASIVGNDVKLTYVPEPGSAMVMAGVIGLLACRRRRGMGV